MLLHWFRLALLLVTVSGAHGAAAGELVLYAREHFAGAVLAVRDAVPELPRAGFAPRMGSMVVRSGRWEVCTRPDFRGACFTAEPGDYPLLGRFINTIVSVREIESRGGADNPRRASTVELFEGQGFDGPRVLVREQMVTLRSVGFNDRAASLMVYGGRWEFCQHEQFGGLCMTYGPGRYEHLGALQRQISSMRRVR
ncbi:MAG: beta/gamma crystallin-related protein [Pseudomonadota bacterium]